MYVHLESVRLFYEKCVKLRLEDCCGEPGIHFIDKDDKSLPNDYPDYFGESLTDLLQALDMKLIDLLPIYRATLFGDGQDKKLLDIQNELTTKALVKPGGNGFGFIPCFPSYNEAMVSEMAKIFKRVVEVIVPCPSIIYEASLTGEVKTSEKSFC